MASFRYHGFLYLLLGLLLASRGPSFAQQSAEATGTQLATSASTDIGTIRRFPVDGEALSIAWSPDGRLLATSSQVFAQITIWDIKTGKPFRQLDRHAAFGKSLAFMPDNEHLLTSAAAREIAESIPEVRRTAVSVWDITSASVATQVAGPYASPELGSNGADVFALGPNAQFLAVVTHGRPPGLIAIYQTSNWTLMRTLSLGTDIAESIAASPDGKWLALGTARSTVTIFDTSNWTLARSINAYASYSAQVTSLAFSPDSHFLASAPLALGRRDRDGQVEPIPDTIRIWNVDTGDMAFSSPESGR